ncbi:MAG: hypothetical protein KA713_05040 [Chryseotalea sp. WA131a]|nr:MAG: hypothetical protein KA713_05040 [Chryseotalea sp. WA131a]
MNGELQELRSITVLNGISKPENGGFFHGWCKEPFYNDLGGYITKTYALIELFNGIVRFIDPTDIRFTKPYMTKEESTSV